MKTTVKIYTKTGDKGETGLVGGKRISKGSARIQTYGDVDELNAVLGTVTSLLDSSQQDIADILKKIQEELFVVGSDLATPLDYTGKRFVPRLESCNVEALERSIDHFEENLPKLKFFILPSGCTAGALLHFARTVCRRAERSVIRLSQEENLGDVIIPYLNRLSDLLFVLARAVNSRMHSPEIPWVPKAY